MSGLWCVNVGYGRQELIDAATRQLKELPFYNNFFQTATPPAIELAELLTEVTPPQFKHVFFFRLRLGGQRHHGAHGAPLLGHPRPAAAQRSSSAARTPTTARPMAGASLGGMSGMHAQGGPADPRYRAHRAAVLVRNWGARSPRGLRPHRRALAGGEDPRDRRRQGGRLHRRAGPGRRRRDRAALDLLARDPAHLRQVRHPARQRRGHHRLRPHRPVVRLRDHGHQARPDDLRQGRDLGLHPAGRRDGRRARRRC